MFKSVHLGLHDLCGSSSLKETNSPFFSKYISSSRHETLCNFPSPTLASLWCHNVHLTQAVILLIVILLIAMTFALSQLGYASSRLSGILALSDFIFSFTILPEPQENKLPFTYISSGIGHSVNTCSLHLASCEYLKKNLFILQMQKMRIES